MKVLDLSYHPLDVHSGRWLDLSRKGNHGMPHGGAKPYMIAPGVMGYWFDGSSGYVDCGNDKSMDITDAITVGAWIYPVTLGEGSVGHIIGRGSIAGWVLYLYAGNRFKFYASSGAINAVSEADAIVLNSWQYVVITYDPINDQNVRFYVNGIAKGVVPETDSITNAGLCIIGARTVTGQYVFDGIITQPIIEDRAWSEAEIKENMYRSPLYRMLRGLPHSQVYITVPWKQTQGGIYAEQK